MRKFVILCIGIAAAIACLPQNTISDGFLDDKRIRLEYRGKEMFVYDEDNCQLSYSMQKAIFGVHTDTMSDYFFLEMSEVPSSIGQEVKARIVWTTERDEESKNDITLQVMKLQGDRIWLWDSSDRIGVVTRVLE